MKKIILDLCGGTASWSLPYKEAGYDVRNITLPEHDVRTYELPKEPIYGILAAPPCTMFSFARTNAKTPRDLASGMDLVYACLNLIWQAQFRLDSDQQKYSPLKFWALENPYYAMTRWFLGKPAFVFDPWEFGDAYKKRTAIWGHFNDPVKSVSDIKSVMSGEQIERHKTNSQKLPTLGRDDEMVKFDYMKSKDIHPEHYGKFDRKTRRAITPRGFAQAFYKANL